ncbi:MAG TPA: T9SS type A sorting domain-containing protein [Bacteroidia bacterium]|nr:T9SS type A sorting domain-containing protein [Bacteroidia bacterium]
MKKRLLVFVFFGFSLFYSTSKAQCTLTALCSGGNWSEAATWSPSDECGGVTTPGDNMEIIVPACATVTVDINSPTYSSMNIHVYGTLFFENGQKINLSANGNVYVYDGGKLDGGNGGSKITIDGSSVWTGPGPDSGPFSFGSAPLPIQLLSFSAIPESNKVTLKWTTATETNNDYFSVERSLDGINFEQIGVVDGAGNSTTIINYTFSDPNPYHGDSYYRLKQTDFDGDQSFSSIVNVNVTNPETSFNVFPNPSDGISFNIIIGNDFLGEEILVAVYDLMGKESYSKIVITGDAGENVYAMDPSNILAPGIYIVTATSKQSIFSKKLIVK